MRSESPLLHIAALEDLAPESAGTEPRLQEPDDDFRDFVTAHEEKAGFSSQTDLTGIESPRPTAVLAIARYLGRMMS